MHGRACRPIGKEPLSGFHRARVEAGARFVKDAKNAVRREARGTISINGDLYAELQAELTRRGHSTAPTVEGLIIDGLNAAGAP